MANSDYYDVRIILSVENIKEPVNFLFRSDLSLGQATDLARSIWLSTSNQTIAVNVLKVGGVVPCITFRSRE